MDNINRKNLKAESIIVLILLISILIFVSSIMGIANLFKTIMSLAHSLILNTCFYIMGVSVLSGGLSELLSEFGIISLINKPIEKIMKPLYGLPGVASLGIVTTYLSDNPAIITLADNYEFSNYFKKYQFPAITNLGTSFGMGLIVSAFILSQTPKNTNYLIPVIIGNIGAIIGSVISVRIMLYFTKKIYGVEEKYKGFNGTNIYELESTHSREGNFPQRVIESLLDGGKKGVDLGLNIIPGVVIITTIIMLFTNEVPTTGIYSGQIDEGIPLLPYIGKKLSFILKPLFGFTNSKNIIFPITSLGSVGAALGTIPQLIIENSVKGNDIAVFTAMGMCWSGYLSTHIAMMDTINMRNLTGKAILSHTIGGLCAGIASHYLYLIVNLI